MKTLIILIVIYISICSEDRYPDGVNCKCDSLISKLTPMGWYVYTPYKNGKINGQIRAYYSDNKTLFYSVRFVNDTVASMKKEFYPSGKIRSISQVNEKLVKHGSSKAYYETGELWQTSHYNNGEYCDTLKIYSKSGILQFLNIYKPAGEEKVLYYNENGILKEESYYKNRNVYSHRSYYESNKKIMHEYYIDRDGNTIHKFYDPQGKEISQELFNFYRYDIP